ncbi:MAG: MazG family protein [bacterium]|nr:MazG family protein [bacterium]
MSGEATVTVVGLGPGDPQDVPPAALERMREAVAVFVRTSRHPSVTRLDAEGIAYETFDYLYEQAHTLEHVYRSIADRLLRVAGAGGPVVYAVPGHPGVAEASVRELMARTDRVELVGAMSGLDAVFALAPLDPARGLVIMDPEGLHRHGPCPDRDLLILQVDDRLLAGQVKLDLLEHYPPAHLVTIIRLAGVPGHQETVGVPLSALDHQTFDHLTSIHVPAQRAPAPRRDCRFPLDPLVDIMLRLRSPAGCPWDRQQTHQSLKSYLLEEAYELAEALDLGDANKLVEELGDLLLQVVFHGVLAMEEGAFDLNQVVRGIAEKLRRRHPHVFGGASLSTSEEVLGQWGRLKAREGGGKLGSIPRTLPALLRAARVQARAEAAGYRLEEAVVPSRWPPAAGEEPAEAVGQFLLAVVQGAAARGVDPEAALQDATDRLLLRLEGQVGSGGKRVEQGRPGEQCGRQGGDD